MIEECLEYAKSRFNALVKEKHNEKGITKYFRYAECNFISLKKLKLSNLIILHKKNFKPETYKFNLWDRRHVL